MPITIPQILVLYFILLGSDVGITWMARKDRRQALHDLLAHVLDLGFLLIGLWIWSFFR